MPKVASPAPEAEDLPPAEDQHEAEDQPQDSPPAEETQQLPVAAGTATDAAPASEEREPAAEVGVTPDTPETPAAEANVTPDPPEAPAPPETPEPPEALATPEAPDTVDLQREVTVVPGVPRYHNPQCLLIRFMGEDDLEKTTLGAARQAGCTPCRACLPDQGDADPELDPPEPERQAEITLDVFPRRLGLRTRADREHRDRQDLAGDRPRVLGQGRDHIRVW